MTFETAISGVRQSLCQILIPAIITTALFGATYGAATAAPLGDKEELVTIGTRTEGRTVVDSPVPIDRIDSQAMEATGDTEVGRILQKLVPSFNFSSSSISDGTDALRPATLRGLGPDQTLVLVNGKRRHGSALIHVNTSVGRGAAGTDLNAIPASAIQRIEVLRDGASAQYGSDAIAGVINIVLKDNNEGGKLAASYGSYSKGDGDTYVVSYNQGIGLGSDGFLNFDIEYRNRENTNRAGLSGQCQYVCADVGNGVVQSTDVREAIFPRQNFRIGDSDSNQLAGTLNLAVPIADSVELYAFGTYSDRSNESGGFYRRANQPDNNPSENFMGVPINDGEAFYPNGFLPLINTDIEDSSIDGGLKGEFAGDWQWDASVGYSMNQFGFNISNSVNASLVSKAGNSPTSADAGVLELSLYTADLGFVKSMGWGSLAFGAAYRDDEYKIKPGEPVSYEDFDTTNGVSDGINDAIGGIQVFPGFSPQNAVSEDRNAWSLYLDGEYDGIERLLVGAAVRYEDYSDFGSTVNGKIAAAFDIVDSFRIRGAVSSGFRAPSLQQQFFNNTSTQFVTPLGGGAAVAQQRGTFRNDSQVAQDIGIPKLKEETSMNYSAGFVWQLADAWTITVDAYRIDIDDRIVLSGSIVAGLDPALDAALLAAGANSAQFFINAADTNTEGVDVIINYGTEVFGGNLDLSLAGNYTETEITKIIPPDSLSSIPGIQSVIFTSQDQSIITEWQPKSRVNLTGFYSRERWNWNLALNYFGEYTVEEGGPSRQTYGGKFLVDTQFSFNVTEQLSINLGGNNIFGETPDINTIGQSRAGTIIDGNGDLIVQSDGVFQYSRRSAPFGFNGAYFYAGADFRF
jgi:iron complex outermembrane receptor protein